MVDFKDIRVKIVSEDKGTGTYEISPLPRGYGHTLANSMRRILLSSIPGAAITSVRIAGIDHEYTTIDGVKEDVVEILMNLKGVRFSLDSEDAQVCTLDISGKKNVTAADIKVGGPLQVVNAKHHIATLTEKSAKLSIELTIEKGYGYKPANEDERADMGRIPVDADFSPVKVVSFDVSNTRKGEATDLDKVTMTVTTDGSIDPQAALLHSAETLQSFAGKVMAALGVPITEVEEKAEASVELIEEVVEEEESAVSNEVLAWKIEDLPISKRSKSGLLAGGYASLGDLSGVSTGDLLNLPGFGNKSLSEVVELLTQYNIELKSE